MPQIIIHLTDNEYQKVKEVLEHNGRTDLENETFSGTEIKLEMSSFGHFLKISGYQKCEINNVWVEFKEK